MKKFQLAILLFVFQLSAFSQFIKWGPESKANKVSGELYSLGWHDGYLYNVEVEPMGTAKLGGNLNLEKLSKTMQVKLSKKLVIKNVSALHTPHIQVFNKQIQVYNFKYFLKANGGSQIICDRFTLDGNSIESSSITSVEDFTGLNVNNVTSSFGSSPNGDRVGFALFTNLKKSNDFEISITTFNPDGTNLLKFNEHLPWDNKYSLINIHEYIIDKNGNSIIKYVVSGLYGTEVYERLLIFDKEGKLIKNTGYENDEMLLGAMKFKLAEDNSLYVSGLIGRRVEDKIQYSGCFIGKYNSSFEMASIKEFWYSEEFFKSLGYKVKKDGRVKFSGGYSIDIVLEKNGGGFLIANHESNFSSISGTNEELMVIGFDSDLTMGEIQVIPRHLNSYNPLLNGLGYFAFIHEGDLNIIYTDHIANLAISDFDDLKEADNPKDNKAVTYMATLQKGKRIQRKILAEENKIGGYLVPDKCRSENNMYVLSYANKGRVLYGQIVFR